MGDAPAHPIDAWSCKDLGDALTAFEPLGRIEALFQSAYPDPARPGDAAVFVRHDGEGRLHCQVTVFFSPACASIAAAMDAEPCERPPANGLGLLAGPAGAWPALFPERGNDPG